MDESAGDAWWRALLWCLFALVATAQLLQFASLPAYLHDYAVSPIKGEFLQERGPLRFRVTMIDASRVPAGVDLRIGDIVRPVSYWWQRNGVGSVDQFVIESRGSGETVGMPYVDREAPRDVVVYDILWPLVQCLELGLGVIVLRSRGAGAPGLALATALICMGMPDLDIFPIPSSSVVTWKAINLAEGLYPFGVSIFGLFAFKFAEPVLRGGELALARAGAWLLMLCAAVLWIPANSDLTGHYEPLAAPAFAMLWIVLWVFVVGLLLTGMRRSVGDDRARFLSILLSCGFLLGVYACWNVYGWWLGHWSYIGGTTAGILVFAGIAALTVSLLRHRVIEMRIVVSRTLVYSIISALLVLMFAGAEYTSDKLLHIEGREKSVLVDLLMANLIIVSFRHVRQFVEQGVQKTLFRPWHQALERLSDFKRDAAFVTDADVLRGRLVEALARFCKSVSPPRLFQLDVDGRYVEWRADAAPPLVIDENRPWVVTLRATLESVASSTVHGDMPGAVAVPMHRRNQLTGFVVCSDKIDRESYRSDELEAIGHAVDMVVLDLAALRTAEAEGRLAEVEGELARTRALLGATKGAVESG